MLNWSHNCASNGLMNWCEREMIYVSSLMRSARLPDHTHLGLWPNPRVQSTPLRVERDRSVLKAGIGLAAFPIYVAARLTRIPFGGSHRSCASFNVI
jgi:hypothetical protein